MTTAIQVSMTQAEAISVMRMIDYAMGNKNDASDAEKYAGSAVASRMSRLLVDQTAKVSTEPRNQVASNAEIMPLPLTRREQNALMHLVAAAHGDGKMHAESADLHIGSYLIDRILRQRGEIG